MTDIEITDAAYAAYDEACCKGGTSCNSTTCNGFTCQIGIAAAVRLIAKAAKAEAREAAAQFLEKDCYPPNRSAAAAIRAMEV